MIRNALITAKPTVGENDKLRIVFTNEFDYDAMGRSGRLEDLKRSVASITGKDVDIEVAFEDRNAAKKIVDISKYIKNITIEYTDSEDPNA